MNVVRSFIFQTKRSMLCPHGIPFTSTILPQGSLPVQEPASCHAMMGNHAAAITAMDMAVHRPLIVTACKAGSWQMFENGGYDPVI